MAVVARRDAEYFPPVNQPHQLNLRSTEAKLDALVRIFRAQERSRSRSMSPCHPKTDLLCAQCIRGYPHHDTAATCRRFRCDRFLADRQTFPGPPVSGLARFKTVRFV